MIYISKNQGAFVAGSPGGGDSRMKAWGYI